MSSSRRADGGQSVALVGNILATLEALLPNLRHLRILPVLALIRACGRHARAPPNPFIRKFCSSQGWQITCTW